MIYVICENDRLVATAKDKGAAIKEMEKLRTEGFIRYLKGPGAKMSFKAYQHDSHWHIHKVKEVRE